MKDIEIIWSKSFNSGGNIDTESRQMYINVGHIEKRARMQHMTFTELFMQVISHEYIHQIIYDIENDKASCDFDHICYKKYKDFKHWIGGVGGDK